MPETPTEASKPCPVCAQGMQRLEHRGLAIRICDLHGLWIDAATFKRLVDRTTWAQRRKLQALKREATASSEERERTARIRRRSYIRQDVFPVLAARECRTKPARSLNTGPRECPDCGVSLRAEIRRDHFKKTPDVMVDVCREHGLWFDHGKLDVLLERAHLDARRSTGERVRRARLNRYEWDTDTE